MFYYDYFGSLFFARRAEFNGILWTLVDICGQSSGHLWTIVDTTFRFFDFLNLFFVFSDFLKTVLGHFDVWIVQISKNDAEGITYQVIWA